jgi:predicted O-methyltransferase YrrM
MGDRLNWFTFAARRSLRYGQNVWSVQYLSAQDKRFTPAWQAAAVIPGWFPKYVGAALFQVLVDLRPRVVVEIGSYLGQSTVFFAKALQVLDIDGMVTAIDPHTGDLQHLQTLGVSELPSFDLFQLHLAAAGVSDLVTPIVATSHAAAQGWSASIDFLFVDGWHSYEAVLQDGHDWIPLLTDNAVVVFDDAVRYPGVRQAVDELVGDGTMYLYGDAYDQAYAGRAPNPPTSVTKVLHSYRPLTRHIPGRKLVR